MATVNSRDRALEVLGLADDVSIADIEVRFRKLVKMAHSDHGGKDEDVAELVAARDFLRDGHHTDLIPVDRGTTVATQRNGELAILQRERYAEKNALRKSREVTQGLARAELTRIERTRRRANLLAWIGGGVGGILVVLRGASIIEGSAASNASVAIIVAILFVAGGLCAAASFLIKGQIATEEQAIEDASEAMGDRSTFLDLFYEIIDESDDPEAADWTAAELKEAIRVWSLRRSTFKAWRLAERGRTYGQHFLNRFATRVSWSIRSIGGQLAPNPAIAELALLIGAAGFYRLLIAKGAETQLLRANESLDEGRIRISYRLVINTEAESSNN